jgi:hypothetical protein
MEETKTLTPKERQLAGLTPVKKGQVLNPHGKKPGTLNRVNQETKELLALAAQQNLPAVNNAIDSLLKSENESARSRGVELYLRMLEFSQPRLSAMAVKGDGVSAGIIVIGKPQDLELPVEDATVIDDNLNDDGHEE